MGLQRRDWLRSALLPGPTAGQKLMEAFLKKRYLQIKHYVSYMEKTTVHTKLNQPTCTKRGAEAAQSWWDLCCLFQDVPWKGAPQPRVTASPAPAEHISLLQTPWAHTVVAISLWGERSPPTRRGASRHPQWHWRMVTAGENGRGQVWVKVCQGRGLNVWCQAGKMKGGWWRKFLPCPDPSPGRSEQFLRCGCLFNTALSCFSCPIQPGKQPSSSGAWIPAKRWRRFASSSLLRTLHLC